MKQPNKDQSSKKENKKVQTNKQFDDNEIMEGTDISINDEGYDKSTYPHKSETDKQFKTQSEFIDRNNDSKDKS